jgi:putative ABC transport system permease protein
METLLRDIRVGFRSLRQRPAFTSVALLTLALGIGASTAIFSVIDAAMLRPLPFPDPDRLGLVWGVAGPDRDVRGASPIEIDDWAAQSSSFTAMSRYDETSVNLSGNGEAEQIAAETVSPGFFEIVGVMPVLGHAIEPEDDQPGGTGGAVISDDLWHSRFGGDPAVLGKSIRLDNATFTIVGVMPPGFKGLSFETDIWTGLAPFVSQELMRDRGNRWLGALARLRPGVTREAAQADLDGVARRLAETWPRTNEDRGADFVPIRTAFLDSARQMLFVLFAGVGLLLLIACANVANLQLVRTNERQRELSVRHALGASRPRVIRQLVTESILLSLGGAGLGMFVASIGLDLLLPLVPQGALPRFVDVGLDPMVIAFAVSLALVAGTVLGIVPALRTNASPASVLKTSRSSDSGWRRGHVSLQQIIVGVEVAVAVILVAGSGLALRSFRTQLAIDPGFQADARVAVRVSLPSDRYDADARRTFVSALLDDVAGGVRAGNVAIGSDAPLRGSSSASILQREGFPEDRIRYYRHSVTPAFFETLGIPIVQGRAFDATDVANGSGVAIVSAALAQRFWPGDEAVGKRLRIGGSTFATVVGVAGNVHFRDLTTSLMDPADDPDVYFAYTQVPTGSFDIVLHEGPDAAARVAAIRQAVNRLDPAVALFRVATLQETLRSQTALSRLTSFLLALFGWLSLLLAAVGLYGVMSFIVRGRRREIAIRSAVGAAPADIRRLVVGQGMLVVLVGLVVGIAGALFTGRVLANLLYGVRAADPLVLALTATAIAFTAVIANLVPARQATRVNPRTAMSAE